MPNRTALMCLRRRVTGEETVELRRDAVEGRATQEGGRSRGARRSAGGGPTNCMDVDVDAGGIVENPINPAPPGGSAGWASPFGTGLSAALKPRLVPGFHPSASIPDAVFAASLGCFIPRGVRRSSAKREEEWGPG